VIRLRPALRIAGREVLRAKGRSALIIALIGLPVLIVTATDVAYRTWQLSPTQKLERQIGSADASLRWYGGALTQTPSGDSYGVDPAESDQETAPDRTQLLALLPSGSRIIELTDPLAVSVRSHSGLATADLIGLDYADPIAKGIAGQVSGRAPDAAGEVAITQHLATNAGLHIGDTLTVSSLGRQYQIVGLVSDSKRHDADGVYALPSVIDALPDNADSASTWLAATPGPVTWSQVRGLNQHGIVARSRYVVAHPPPKSQVLATSGPSVSRQVFASGIVVVGLALLEIVLLAGPAFAVGARRARRQLALIAAVGGRRQDLRNVVLANAVVLGVAAGVAGLALGALGTAAGIWLFGSRIDTIPGPFDIRPLELLGIASISLISALAAALVPARAAARTDVVAALAGRRGDRPGRKRVPAIGVTVAGIGVAIALVSARSANASLILAGVALTEIGLIICTPTILGLIARLGRFLPLAPRIALREAGRNRSAAASAIAAVMAAVIGSVAAAIIVASAGHQSKANYQPEIPMGDAYVILGGYGNGSGGGAPTTAQADRVVTALRSQLPTRSVSVVSSVALSCAGTPCNLTTLDLHYPSTACQHMECFGYGTAYPPTIIDDGSHVDAILGVSAPAAAAALRAGHAVVVDPKYLTSGTITLSLDRISSSPTPAVVPCPVGLSHGATAATCAVGSAGNPTAVTVPAIAVAGGFQGLSVILPPTFVTSLGLTREVQGVLADTTRPPTSAERQKALAAVDQATANARIGLIVESGYHSDSTLALLAIVAAAGLITIGAAIIATALAAVDGRADLTILSAVGASPRTRRILSMARAGVITAVGTVLGVAAGFVPAGAWILATRRGDQQRPPGWHELTLVVPWWPTLLATVIIVPAVAMGLAGLFTRSRLASERAAD
jgi:putative ABC transport system permease protein